MFILEFFNIQYVPEIVFVIWFETIIPDGIFLDSLLI